MLWPGRHYHRVYGYPVRWAVLAELAWRLEHCGVARMEHRGYAWRKRFERRASRA
jgi:hypothetical protein